MRLTYFKLLVGLAILALSSDVSGQERLLDLTKLHKPPASTKSSGTVGGMGHSTLRRIPLEVSIISAEAGVTEGKAVILVLMSVKNTGDTPLDLPATLDYKLNRDDNPALGLYLSVQSSSGKVYEAGSNGLYGSKSIAGSLMIINPRESVRIRAAFRAIEAPSADVGAASVKVGLRIHLDFIGGPFAYMSGVDSPEPFSYLLSK